MMPELSVCKNASGEILYSYAGLKAWRLPPFFRREYSLLAACIAVVLIFTGLRYVFSTTIELRVDEAYYWTWSREHVISYLDHPPMIAWLIRWTTAMFGNTNFGVRASGLLAMIAMQLLLADIVWQTLRDWRYVAFVVLLPEAAIDYGLLITRMGPDTPLVPFAVAMVWALVRLSLSGNMRWWLAAGVFGGFSLLSKYTVVLLLPAIVAFMLVPSWRSRHLRSPWFWAAALIAVTIFSPVLYWNATHDWESFRFQLDRPTQIQRWSAKFLLDFLGQQFGLVGPLLFPMVVIAAGMLAWRGYRAKDPVSILLSTCVLVPLGFFVWRSFYGRIGDGWPLMVWPFGFACAVINLKLWRQEAPASPTARMAPAFAITAVISGLALVFAASIYYVASGANYLKGNDPIGKEASFSQVVETANKAREKVGATWFAATDYRIYSMLRWHLRDRVAVIQVNERNRYIDFQIDKAALGPVGLYVAPDDRLEPQLWKKTTAVLEPVGSVDLSWRGIRYDTYSLQKLTGWRPVLSPPPGDDFYAASPH